MASLLRRVGLKVRTIYQVYPRKKHEKIKDPQWIAKCGEKQTTADDEWIAKVAEKHWKIITSDKDLEFRYHEAHCRRKSGNLRA